MMTALFIGGLGGYILGHLISDSIWKSRFEEFDKEDGEWVDVIPNKHIKKRRRYS